ncbi:MAG TPA: MFS transporter [Rhizomicrobium sp.]|jgi:Na+/melibiose symporter-like transporter
MSSQTKRTPFVVLFSYVLPAFAIAAFGMPLTVYLPNFYASKEFAISLGTVGVIFAAIRLVDVFIDPAIGYLSDQLRTRFGRRRPMILLGTPFMALGIWMIYAPPAGIGPVYLTAWLLLMYFGYSLILVPHLSWGSELSTEYHERSRIYGWLQILTVAGMMTVLLVPAVMSIKGFSAPSQIEAMGLLSIASLVIGVAACLAVVPETSAVRASRAPLFATLRFVLGHPAMWRLMLLDFLESLNQGSRGVVFLYFAAYALLMPKYGTLLLVGYFLSGVIFAPAWIALSRRIGKHKALNIAYVYGIVMGPTLFFIPAGNFLVAFAIITLSGASYAAPALFIRAMMADVADADTYETKAERAGLMYSFLSLTSKVGLAVAVLIALKVLSAIGFDPKHANPASVIADMRMLYILTPVGFAISTLVLMLGYPLTEDKQRELRSAIERRAQSEGEAKGEGDFLSGLVVTRADAPAPETDALNDAILAKGPAE